MDDTVEDSMTGSVMCDPAEEKKEAEMMNTHTQILLDLLKSVTRLETKIDLMQAEDAREDASESAAVVNPMITSPQLEFDLPPPIL